MITTFNVPESTSLLPDSRILIHCYAKWSEPKYMDHSMYYMITLGDVYKLHCTLPPDDINPKNSNWNDTLSQPCTLNNQYSNPGIIGHKNE